MRLRPFILCFNRTGKQGAKASETGHDREGNTHPKRLSSSSSERYSPGLFIHRPQTPQRWFERASAGTHATPAPKRAHSGSHAETRGVSDGGWYHYPRSVLRGSETLRGRVSERRTLPLLGLGRMYSQRTQKAFVTAMRMMRVAVTRRRGPAGLRDPIVFSLTALIGFTVLADRDYRVRKKAHFVFMRRAVLPALPAPSAALLYALMH